MMHFDFIVFCLGEGCCLFKISDDFFFLFVLHIVGLIL